MYKQTTSSDQSLDMYGAGSTLRFPRFMSFRTDKSWKDILTYTGKDFFTQNERRFSHVYQEMIKARKEGTFGGKKRSASQQDLM